MPEVNGVSLPFLPAGGISELQRKPAPSGTDKQGASFEKLFREELDKLKFSGHAQKRMISREISLTENEMQKLDTAIEKARDKGAVESLIAFDDKAFIVNIPNKTVITAVTKEQMSSNVITKIDSAIFA